MPKAAIIRAQATPLPKFNPPASVAAARTHILGLARSLHEHAYLLGRYLSWVRQQVGRGKFTRWIEANVWFSYDTAARMMGFAKRCDSGTGRLLAYQPGKDQRLRTVRSRALGSLSVGEFVGSTI